MILTLCIFHIIIKCYRSLCLDDTEFIFEYKDEITNENIDKCSKLSRKENEVIDRACEEQYMYPDGSGELTTLKHICISTCDNCP